MCCAKGSGVTTFEASWCQTQSRLAFSLLRHTRSWEIVHSWVDHNLKVWSLKAETSPLPTLLPWIEERFEDQTFLRTASEEGHVLYFNLPSMGVISAAKLNYVHALCTSFLAARPTNSVAVIIHANRASEGRKSRTQGQLEVLWQHMLHQNSDVSSLTVRL